jgi:hypothetical protein
LTSENPGGGCEEIVVPATLGGGFITIDGDPVVESVVVGGATEAPTGIETSGREIRSAVAMAPFILV